MSDKIIIKRFSRDFQIEENNYYKIKIKNEPNDFFCCQIHKINDNKLFPSLSLLYSYNKKIVKNVDTVTSKEYFMSDDITSIDPIKTIDVPFKLYTMYKNNK